MIFSEKPVSTPAKCVRPEAIWTPGKAQEAGPQSDMDQSRGRVRPQAGRADFAGRRAVRAFQRSGESDVNERKHY